MTRFSKILVWVNLVMSLVFASWALAIHTQRVDWTAARAVPRENTVAAPNPSGNPVNSVENKESSVASVQKDPGDPTVVQIKGLQEGSTHVVLTDADGKKQGFDVYVDGGVSGKLADRIDEIRDLKMVRAKMEADHLAAYQDLTSLEKQRPVNQKWYAEQLGHLERGTQPVQQVAYSGGKPQIDSTQRPVMEKATTKNLNAIQPRDTYLSELDKLAKDIQDVRNVIRNRLAEQAKYSDQLKDIRARLAREEEELRKMAEEREYLQPVLYNRQAEAQTLRERQERLNSRLEELKRAGVTAR
jgi:hypothetical protein